MLKRDALIVIAAVVAAVLQVARFGLPSWPKFGSYDFISGVVISVIIHILLNAAFHGRPAKGKSQPQQPENLGDLVSRSGAECGGREIRRHSDDSVDSKVLSGHTRQYASSNSHDRRDNAEFGEDIMGIESTERFLNVKSGSTNHAPDFLNEILRLMWPRLSDCVRGMLITDVEPALQAAVPKLLSGIRFSRDQCHLGNKPMRFLTLTAEADERWSEELGVFTCIRLVGDVVLDGTSEINLIIPGIATVGASCFKLEGRLVIELFRLLPHMPIVGGMRVYFANPPALDIKMTGRLGALLNLGMLKRRILDVLSNQLRNKVVLPQRITSKLSDVVDPIRLKSSRPEGILRVGVLEVRGLRLEDKIETRCGAACARSLRKKAINGFTQLSFGGSVWRNEAVQSTDAGCFHWASSGEGVGAMDFPVHDRHAQWLEVSVFRAERSVAWGSWTGEMLGGCRIPVPSLVEIARTAVVGESLWTLDLDEGDMDIQRNISRMYDETNSCGRMVSDPARLRGQRRGSIGSTQLIGPHVRLVVEWRPISRSNQVARQLLAGEPLGNPWVLRHCEPSKEGIVAVLLVGVYGATGLPHEAGTYCCRVVSRDGERCKSKDSPHVVGVLERGSAAADRSSLQASGTDSVCVHWETPFFFNLRTPTEATVDISVFSVEARGERRRFGSATLPVVEALRRRSMQLEYTQVQLRSGGDLAPGRPGQSVGASVRVRVVLKLWLLGVDAEKAPPPAGGQAAGGSLPHL